MFFPGETVWFSASKLISLFVRSRQTLYIRWIWFRMALKSNSFFSIQAKRQQISHACGMGQNKQLMKANQMKPAFWAESHKFFCYKILQRNHKVLRCSILVKGNSKFKQIILL